MKYQAVGFDLGNTLTYRSGVTPSWRQYYPKMLASVAAACDCQPSAEAITAAEEILLRYNTRFHPRTIEVPVDTILQDIFQVWGLEVHDVEPAIEAFFGFNMERECLLYEDTLPALHHLRAGRLPIGILSNVAYGMPTRYYAADMVLLDGYIDLLLTSVDVGFRKPAPDGFLRLAAELGIEPSAMVFVGDEEVDITGAHSVGMTAVYLNRTGSDETFGADRVITSLTELPAVLEMPLLVKG